MARRKITDQRLQGMSTEDKAKLIGNATILSSLTVRQSAEIFHISKSYVHRLLKDVLPLVDPDLYAKVRIVLDYNRLVRVYRGGEAVRAKYAGEKLPIAL